MTTLAPLPWGDAAVYTVDVSVSIAGKTLIFVAKHSTTDADPAAIITKRTGAGIAHTDEANGIAEVTVLTTDTATLSPSESTVLQWAVKMLDGTYPYTMLSGTLTVTPNVIRAVV